MDRSSRGPERAGPVGRPGRITHDASLAARVYAARVSGHPNAALARAAWDAISQGDAPGLRSLLSSDLVWHATAQGTPWSGEHRGQDEILDFLARIGEVTEVFHASLLDILASDARALVVFQVEIELGGRRVELPYLLLGRVEEGRFAEIWTVPLDPEAIAKFWSPPTR